MFHTENARMLSVFYLNLLFLACERMLPPRWVVFRVVTGKFTVGCCAHCAPAVQERLHIHPPVDANPPPKPLSKSQLKEVHMLNGRLTPKGVNTTGGGHYGS